MSKYIDADKLTKHMNDRLAELYENYGGYDHYATGYSDAIDAIESAPTADVVEVVRCKDCKHNDGCNQYVLHYGDECELAFCSYGERKEV